MTVSLFSELLEIKSIHAFGRTGSRITKKDWKREALKFQQLMLDNPWLENVDVNLEYATGEGDDDILVHVTHPEFMDLSFSVSQGFSITTPESTEWYGITAQEAYASAMPILIGLKAGFKLKKKQDKFNDFMVHADNGVSSLKMIHPDYRQPSAFFIWNVTEQGFEPVDEENLPDNHGEIYKTIDEMLDYLESWSS